MFKYVLGIALAFFCCSAAQATCTPPSNGTTADATLLNAYLNCEFAPLVSPTFTGNVGIGTMTPAQTLSVNGTASVSGHSAMGNSAVIDQNTGLIGPGIEYAPLSVADSTSGDLSGHPHTGIGEYSQFTHTGTAGAAMHGLDVEPATASGSTGPITVAHGIYSAFENNGSGNVANLTGIEGDGFNEGSATITTLTGGAFYTESDVGTVTNAWAGYFGNGSYGGTIGSAAGVYIDVPFYGSGSAVTNNYGLYIANQTSTHATNDFQFYSNGTAPTVITPAGNVGIGTVTPAQALEVNGEVKVDTFATASSTAVCQNSGVLSSCSSSLRYKENVEDADFGLNEVLQMRPVTFKWKGRDENDIGLIAEEVAKINPLFVTYRDGKVEGVKYAQLTAVLINAIKALKAQNEHLKSASNIGAIKELKALAANQAAEITTLQSRFDDEDRRLSQSRMDAFVRVNANSKSQPGRNTGGTRGEISGQEVIDPFNSGTATDLENALKTLKSANERQASQIARLVTQVQHLQSTQVSAMANPVSRWHNTLVTANR